MIDISKLKKGSRIIRHWSEGETKTSEFIVTMVVQDPEVGYICYADWADDDYSTTIYEDQQHQYEYGRRRLDRKPKTAKEIIEEMNK